MIVYLRRTLAALCLFSVALLAGCADRYSEAVKFRPRVDPVFKLSPDQLKAKDRVLPDPPGQLPLLTLAKMTDWRNPYYQVSADVKQRIEENVLDPRTLHPKDKAEFQRTLTDLFGTPAGPTIGFEADRDALKLDIDHLIRGSRLYRAQCLTCHGLTGDGRGPTALWVNPHPRDYRLGKFKFQSVDQSDGTPRKPLRQDLYDTLVHGIEGTSMPAFNLLSKEDLDALVSYVIYLSIRGEAEYQTLVAGIDKANGKKGLVFSAKKIPQDLGISRGLTFFAKTIFTQWEEAQKKPIDDPEYPFQDAADEDMFASVQRGYAFFEGDADLIKKHLPASKYAGIYPKLFPKIKMGDKEIVDVKKSDEAIQKFVKGFTSCKSCHEGKGKRAFFKFDEWGTLTRPRNLTTGVYRGGRRPIDLYWRIHSGINGTGMPSFKNAGLKDEQIWDLVNFVRALPYPAMRQKYKINLP